MSPSRSITATELLEAPQVGDDCALEGPELAKLFAVIRSREKDCAQQESFWSATNDALADACWALETRTAELEAARKELVLLNERLESRVAQQVSEIVLRASEVDALNRQLERHVQERSHQLADALRRLAGAHHSPPLMPNDVVGGRVRVEKVLGYGGMGTVYAGVDLISGDRVAVKLMHPDVESSVAAVRRFVEEAEASSKISNPGVVKTLHLDIEPDGRLYQIMEFVDGVELGRRRGGPLFASAAVARIGAGIARSLAAAHAAGIVHRDIKPSNVMLCATAPGVRVLDFGISKILNDGGGSGHDVSMITRATDFVGTPHYASPEQIGRASDVTPASDVYSTGVLLYELLSGRLPFAGKHASELLIAHLKEDPPDLASLVPQAPAILVELVTACLAKDPGARPSSDELACSLDALADAARAPTLEAIAATEVRRFADETGRMTRPDAAAVTA